MTVESWRVEPAAVASRRRPELVLPAGVASAAVVTTLATGTRVMLARMAS